MHSTQSPIKNLADHSVAVLPPLYSENTVVQWNQAFDQIFSSQNKPRRYVSSADFYNLGMLDEIFNDSVLSLIFSLIPDAELYHCHAYEIEGNQTQPHIMNGNGLDGWHRDYDCKHDIAKQTVQHISLFIYLSDVLDNSGAFEVSTKKLSIVPWLNKKERLFKVIGQTGTSFLFDRKAYHRASPNREKTSRRVLKLSFQSQALFNHKQLESNFKYVRSKLTNSSTLLRQLFGDTSITELELKRQIEQLPSSKNCNSELPNCALKNTFTPKQKLLRNYRDIKFIGKRCLAKLSLVNDQERPQAKY